MENIDGIIVEYEKRIPLIRKEIHTYFRQGWMGYEWNWIPIDKRVVNLHLKKLLFNQWENFQKRVANELSTKNLSVALSVPQEYSHVNQFILIFECKHLLQSHHKISIHYNSKFRYTFKDPDLYFLDDNHAFQTSLYHKEYEVMKLIVKTCEQYALDRYNIRMNMISCGMSGYEVYQNPWIFNLSPKNLISIRQIYPYLTISHDVIFETYNLPVNIQNISKKNNEWWWKNNKLKYNVNFSIKENFLLGRNLFIDNLVIRCKKLISLAIKNNFWIDQLKNKERTGIILLIDSSLYEIQNIVKNINEFVFIVETDKLTITCEQLRHKYPIYAFIEDLCPEIENSF